MRQIEISNNEANVYQTFIIDNSQPFPYYRPLYLIGRVNDVREAAKSAKRQYFLDHGEEIPTIEKYKERKKQLKVIAWPCNREKDIEISKIVDDFNNAKDIQSRAVSEIAHRIAEEQINKLAITY